MPSIEQITTKLYKHYSGVADSRTNRDFFEEAISSSFNVRPDQLWAYGDQVPRPTSPDEDSYKKVKAFKNGDVWTWQKDESTYIPVFTKYENYPLTKIDNGTDKSFKLVDEKGNQIKNIIPFNYALDLYNYYLTTDDGSYGIKGFGTTVLNDIIEREKVDYVIAVGPMPMMRAVAEMTRDKGIYTEASMNPIMVDGTGMCGACRVTVGGETKFACVDGPDFNAHEIDFDEVINRTKIYKDYERKRDENCNLLKQGERI